MKNKYQFNIIVETDNDLTNDDKSEILHNFRARLQGHKTEVPESLKNCKMNIVREVTITDIYDALKT